MFKTGRGSTTVTPTPYKCRILGFSFIRHIPRIQGVAISLKFTETNTAETRVPNNFCIFLVIIFSRLKHSLRSSIKTMFGCTHFYYQHYASISSPSNEISSLRIIRIPPGLLAGGILPTVHPEYFVSSPINIHFYRHSGCYYRRPFETSSYIVPTRLCTMHGFFRLE